jgi:acetylornithine deacetylase/succinyl-diaminopimelate desuccinylase-like protein
VVPLRRAKAAVAPRSPTPPGDWLAELAEFLRIPSVSADPAHAGDVRDAAEWVAAFVRAAGGRCEVVATERHPLAVGEIPASSRAAGPDPPTVLLYGHFDVQPPGDAGAWESPPFEPLVRGEWLYGRGAADDKGNLYLLLKAAALLAAEGRLPVDVRIACDGEEEIVGDSIVEFLRADERGADACLIFDGPMPQRDVPYFVLGLRGVLYYHLVLRTGARDLHSGMLGGAALNALSVLAHVLAEATARRGELREGALRPSSEELAHWATLEPGAEALRRQGARPADETAAEEFYLRTWAAPALDVNGIRGGEPDLQKTVLPVEAVANVSVRLAPGQDPETVSAAFERLLREAVPPGAELLLERWAATPPGLIPPDSPALRLARDAFERVLGRAPVLIRSGGTLPIFPALAGRGMPVLLTGFDVPEGNVHAPNERLLVEYVPLGVAAAQETLLALGSLPR